MFRGIRAAAHAYGCNLLLACGIGPHSIPFEGLAAWPVALSDTNVVPVGPWNTDGLIAIPPFTKERQQAIAALAQYGKPIVFTSPQAHYPSQAPTNAEGITQAFDHLRAHGHRRIAFIAAEEQLDRISDGDGAERFNAYRAALAAHELPFDPALIGYGGHDAYHSAIALRKLLAASVEFSAVLTSNDESAIGVMQALAEAGLRVPQDVAVIGFDDVLYAKAQSPPLTTIRHPTFEMGYQAVELLLDYIHGRRSQVATLRTPTRLIVRESCGCQPYSAPITQSSAKPGRPLGQGTRRREVAFGVLRGAARPSRITLLDRRASAARFDLPALIQAMGDAVSAEARYRRRADSRLVPAAGRRVPGQPRPGRPAAAGRRARPAVAAGESANEDAYAWQAAIGVLRAQAGALGAAYAPAAPPHAAEQLIDQGACVSASACAASTPASWCARPS